MSDTQAQGFDYSEYKPEAGHNLLAQITQTAVELKDAQALVASLEEQLKEAKGTVTHLGEHVLPTLMDEADLGDFTTKDGIFISVNERIRASIPARSHVEAIKWLEENGEDSIIKRQFTIEFGRDENGWADKFERDLAQRKKKLHCKRKTSVHPQTLAKAIGDKLAEGVEVPMETFGAFRQRFSTIKVK